MFKAHFFDFHQTVFVFSSLCNLLHSLKSSIHFSILNCILYDNIIHCSTLNYIGYDNIIHYRTLNYIVYDNRIHCSTLNCIEYNNRIQCRTLTSNNFIHWQMHSWTSVTSSAPMSCHLNDTSQEDILIALRIKWYITRRLTNCSTY